MDCKTYVDNNETIATNAKNAWSDELNKKFAAQITNQERELGFYQNFIETYFDNMESQMSYYVGQSLVPRITPDPNYGGLLADVWRNLWNKDKHAQSQSFARIPTV